ncbi:hypothetical protein ABT158_49720 [Nonomuraea sp. NPDC001636]|uniref:hypothetical protein n=1 Tax=Nonomuraea sp. NPDC001636 TaxID=3154391 RepID=UPI00331C4026
MDIALPGLADEGHADLVRDSLITLLTVMRPDWGSRQAVAERLRFAEQPLGLSLPQLCLRTVTAAVTPNSAPDSFISTTPADALRHLASPERTSEAITQLRRQLAAKTTSRAPASASPASKPQTGGEHDDPEQVAADRAMLAQAMAEARRKHDTRLWARSQRVGEHLDDVPHALDEFAGDDLAETGPHNTR